MSENNNQPKHTLAITGLTLGIISIFTSIMLILGIDNMNDNNGGILLALSMYSAIPSIICSAIAKIKHNTEKHPTIGLLLSIISIIILIIFIAANS